MSTSILSLTVWDAIGVSAPTDTLEVFEFGLWPQLLLCEAQDLCDRSRFFHLDDPDINYKSELLISRGRVDELQTHRGHHRSRALDPPHVP